MATSGAKIESINRGTKFSTPVDSLGIEPDEISNAEETLLGELKKKTVEELRGIGVGLIHEAKKATSYYKAIAAVVVAIQAKHKATKKRVGRKLEALPQADRGKLPDWNRTSEGATAAITQMYADAGIPTAKHPIRKSIQYHVDVLVREVATEAQLKKLGLIVEARGKRAPGGSTAQTGGSTTTTTGQVTNPVQVLEQIGPRVVQLQIDVIRKGVLKTDIEKKKVLDYAQKMADHFIAIIEYLKPQQTEEAATASKAEEKRIIDAKK